MRAEVDVAGRVAGIVRKRFKELGLASEPNGEQDLRDAGMTSLALVELIFLVEDHFGVPLPDGEINVANFRSIESIAQMMSRITAG